MHRRSQIRHHMAVQYIGLDNDRSYSVIFSWTGYSPSHAADHGELAGVYADVP